MSENGFNEITTLECLNRPYDVRTVVMSMPDLGYGPGRYWSGEAKLSAPTIGHVEVSDAQEKKLDSVKVGSSTAGQQLSSDSESKTEADDVDIRQAVDSNECGRAKMKTAKASYVCKSGMASLSMTGHTGFLTFATLYP